VTSCISTRATAAMHAWSSRACWAGDRANCRAWQGGRQQQPRLSLPAGLTS
jgi:hypothetical protein